MPREIPDFNKEREERRLSLLHKNHFLARVLAADLSDKPDVETMDIYTDNLITNVARSLGGDGQYEAIDRIFTQPMMQHVIAVGLFPENPHPSLPALMLNFPLFMGFELETKYNVGLFSYKVAQNIALRLGSPQYTPGQGEIFFAFTRGIMEQGAVLYDKSTRRSRYSRYQKTV